MQSEVLVYENFLIKNTSVKFKSVGAMVNVVPVDVQNCQIDVQSCPISGFHYPAGLVRFRADRNQGA